MKKNIFSLALALSFGVALMFMSSCSKEDKKGDDPTPFQEQRKKERISEVVKKIPIKNLVEELRNKLADGTIRPNDWSFAQPTGGYTYSYTSTYTTSTGTTYVTNSYTVYTAYNSFGAGSGGGTVVAGPSSLDVNYTFCFSASDAAFGLGLINTGANTSGMSSVIGVSGDFEALQNASNTADLLEAFHGMAFYYVYDEQASGSYDVIDFSEVTWSNTNSFDNKCFAFIWDIQNGRFFVSKSGHINVTGGEMNFSGDYYMLTGFLTAGGDPDPNNTEATISVVNGFGAMGCN